MTNDSLIAYFQQHHPDLLETIRLLVTQETPSHDKPRLDAFAALLAARLTDAGATVEIVDQPARGNHLRARFVHGASTEKPALVLCHYDTVWPVGALATHPFRIEAGKAYGPGIFDMQSSLALVEYGLRAVRDLDIALPRPITAVSYTHLDVYKRQNGHFCAESTLTARVLPPMPAPAKSRSRGLTRTR